MRSSYPKTSRLYSYPLISGLTAVVQGRCTPECTLHPRTLRGFQYRYNVWSRHTSQLLVKAQSGLKRRLPTPAYLLRIRSTDFSSRLSGVTSFPNHLKAPNCAYPVPTLNDRDHMCQDSFSWFPVR